MSAGSSAICKRKECFNAFVKKTHNQIYCSDECCKRATNDKIMERYYEKKRLKNSGPRNCSVCDVTLSRYNESNICSVCQSVSESVASELIMSRMSNVVWE